LINNGHPVLFCKAVVGMSIVMNRIIRVEN
jgi:hypothetical protein